MKATTASFNVLQDRGFRCTKGLLFSIKILSIQASALWWLTINVQIAELCYHPQIAHRHLANAVSRGYCKKDQVCIKHAGEQLTELYCGICEEWFTNLDDYFTHCRNTHLSRINIMADNGTKEMDTTIQPLDGEKENLMTMEEHRRNVHCYFGGRNSWGEHSRNTTGHIGSLTLENTLQVDKHSSHDDGSLCHKDEEKRSRRTVDDRVKKLTHAATCTIVEDTVKERSSVMAFTNHVDLTKQNVFPQGKVNLTKPNVLPHGKDKSLLCLDDDDYNIWECEDDLWLCCPEPDANWSPDGSSADGRLAAEGG